MLDTYIKNKGKTKTLMYNNNHSNVNELKWDADYDGKVANISLDLVNDGKRGHYDVKLTNKDIEDILNIPSVNMPLERRLQNDFNNHNIIRYPLMRETELQMLNIKPPTKIEPSIEELIKTAQNQDIVMSSPSNKEFIIPLTLDNNNIRNRIFIPKKKHKKHKTRKIYKIYKVYKKHPSKKHPYKKHRKNKTYKLTTFPFI